MTCQNVQNVEFVHLTFVIRTCCNSAQTDGTPRVRLHSKHHPQGQPRSLPGPPRTQAETVATACCRGACLGSQADGETARQWQLPVWYACRKMCNMQRCSMLHTLSTAIWCLGEHCKTHLRMLCSPKCSSPLSNVSYDATAALLSGCAMANTNACCTVATNVVASSPHLAQRQRDCCELQYTVVSRTAAIRQQVERTAHAASSRTASQMTPVACLGTTGPGRHAWSAHDPAK